MAIMASDQIAQLLTMTTVSAVAFVIEILVFLVLFRPLSHIYCPRIASVSIRERIVLHAPESLLGWIKPLFTSEQIILERCGLDSYLLIRYFNMLLRMLFVLSLINNPLLPYLNRRGGAGIDEKFRGFSILNMSADMQKYCWVHVGAAFVVVAYVCNEIRKEKLNYIRARRHVHLSPDHRDKPSLTTILIRNIPELLRSNSALRQAFQKYPGGIRNTSVLRDYSKLEKAVHTRDYWLRRLEWAETCLIKTAERAHRKEHNLVSDDEWDLKAKLLAVRRGLWMYSPEDWEGWHDEEDSDVGSVIRHHSRRNSIGSSGGRKHSIHPDEVDHNDAESVMVGVTVDDHAIPYIEQHSNEEWSFINQQPYVGNNDQGPPSNSSAGIPQPRDLWKEYLDERTYSAEIDLPRKKLAHWNETILEAQNGTYPRIDAAFVTFYTQQAAIMAASSSPPFGFEDARVEMAPDPHDIMWANFSRSFSYERNWILRGCHLLLALLPFFWLPTGIAEISKYLGRVSANRIARDTMMTILPQLLQVVCYYLWTLIAAKRPYISRTKIGLLEYELNFLWSIWWGVLISLLQSGFIGTIEDIDSRGWNVILAIGRNVIEAADWYLLLMFIVALNVTGSYVFNIAALLACCKGSASTPRQVWEQGRMVMQHAWAWAYVSVQAMGLTGIVFSVTAPIVVPMIIAPCALVILSIRYNIIYINRQKYSVHGAFFIRALNHLFVGLYLLELLLFSLFMDGDKYPGRGTRFRSAAIAVLFLATVTYHIRFHQSLSHDLNATDWLEKGTNPNNIPTTSPTPASSPSTSPLDTSLPGSMTLRDLWPEDRDALINAAYLHPGAKVPRAVVWIPRDNTGVSDDEILLTEAKCERREEKDGVVVWRSMVLASNCGAAVGAKGGIVIARPAPDWEQIHEVAV